MHSDTYGTAWTWKPLRISPARSSGVELITAILCYTVHRMQINTNCSCYKTRWLESSHVPGNMITLRRSYVTFTGCRSPRASIIRLQCLLTSSCPPTHRLICRKSSRFIILHDSCVLPLTARSLSPTLEHSSAQGLFDTLHRQYGTAFLHRSPPRHRLWLHLSVI